MAKVTKFGGTSVATADALRQVARLVGADPERRYIVVSAPGKRRVGDVKVTDLLRAFNKQRDPELLQKVFDRYSEIVRDLGLELNLVEHYVHIIKAIEAGASDDFVESRGEYLLGMVAAPILERPFVDPAGFIIFDEKGDFLEEETYARTAAVLSRFPTAVIPGYYGCIMNDPARIKVFPRGGSDITGAIVARGVEASLYENFTDVCGVFTAHPSIVPEARTIPTITYAELMEFADKGAEVIHPAALYPVMDALIPTRILNTFKPDGPSTNIEPYVKDRKGAIVGVTGRPGFSVLSATEIRRAMLKKDTGFTLRILQVLADLDVSYDHLTDSPNSLSIVVDDEQLKNGKRHEIIERVRAVYPQLEFCIRTDAVVLSVVGEGMVRTVGSAAKFLTSLANAGVNILTLDQSVNEMVITVSVDVSHYKLALQAAHRDLIEN